MIYTRTVDLHVHLVPGVDDGPATWDEAFSMLNNIRQEMPVDSTVVATPHTVLSLGDRVMASQERRVQEYLFRADIDPGRDGLRILAGREVMLDGGRMSPSRLDRLSLPGTSWVLVELPPRLSWFRALRRVASVVRCGFRPLLAHPERYRWCRSAPQRLLKLSEAGAAIQVSARSLAAGGPAASCASLLIETGLVHVLASDAHLAGDRLLSQGLAEDVERIRPGAYRMLTVEMPGRILDNRDLPSLPLGPKGSGGGDQ